MVLDTPEFGRACFREASRKRCKGRTSVWDGAPGAVDRWFRLKR